MSIDAEDLERYLHEHIPLSAAMGARVVEADEEHVVLAAPLAANVNHRDSAFGGSESALAILAAWSLVHLRLRAGGISPRIVIQRNAVEYEAPILGDFTATASAPPAQVWNAFIRTLHHHGKGRIRVDARVSAEGVDGATFTGDFVAIDTAF